MDKIPLPDAETLEYCWHDLPEKADYKIIYFVKKNRTSVSCIIKFLRILRFCYISGDFWFLGC